jgi:hypothetical protein
MYRHVIDHLGIISGIIDDIGIVKIVNQRVGEHSQEQVSAGHVELKADSPTPSCKAALGVCHECSCDSL